MKVVLTTKFTEGGTQMCHVFDELEAQGLKPKMLFKKDHDEITFEVPTVEPQGFEDYLKQYLGENDLKIIGNDVWEETKAKAEQTDWISVKDRLPRYDGEYYVTYEDSSGIRDTDVDYFRTNGKGWVYYNVIAWREKFSPYRGE